MNCPKCGLPEELCACEEITREGQRIRITSDRRKYGKIVTIVNGVNNVDAEKVAKQLRKKLACGGTVRENTIELQGDHMNRIKDLLADMGFSKDQIETGY